MGVGQLSESDAVDALRLPFYSSSHPTGSHGWRNQFDLGNPDWDVEGGLHPEERPRVGLWLSEQFLLPADVFLQSFSSTPTVRPRQHVAICLGNAVRELAVAAQVSGLW